MRNFIALLLLTLSGLVQAQTFTVSPLSGPGPFTVTWDVPGGTNCQASGIADWSGAVAASGTKSVSPLPGNKSLALVCTVPGTPTKGSAHLTWAAPTLNTDGTPYTNAQGYQVFADQVSPPIKLATTVTPATVLTADCAGLDAGTWYFGVKALSTQNSTSDLSLVVSKSVTVVSTTTTWSKTIPITVVKSQPPTGLSVTITNP